MDRSPVVFLFDVDNTLLDNDRVQDDLRKHMLRQFGESACDLYWQTFEKLRDQLGYADYLGAMQQYRQHHLHDPRLLLMAEFLIDYPFAERLYPHALATIDHARQSGPAVIVSDGDVVFQPRKVERAGLWQAVDGHVLIYIHKEQELADVARRYRAEHYVLVDDKLRILDAVKKVWGKQVTTVFPRQGHYAHDPHILAQHPAADVTIETIGELRQFRADDLVKRAK